MKIDGVDISQYGVFVVYNGYNGMLVYPEIKEPDKNDWPERDGIDVDLSEIHLNPKVFKIDFASDRNGDVDGFLSMLLQPGERHIEYDLIGFSIYARVLSIPDLSKLLIPTFTVEFSEDNPSVVEFSPVSLNLNSGYLIDGLDFTEYGVDILEGSFDEITKPYPIKKNLSVSLKNKSGQYYNSNRVKYAEKQVKINCLMRANSKNDFIANYNALLYILTLPEYRHITHILSYECYYKSMDVVEFDLINGVYWLKFSLNFVFTKLGV